VITFLRTTPAIWQGVGQLSDIDACTPIGPRFYADLWGQEFTPEGALIFSDLERLDHRERASATDLWTALEQPGQVQLNHPARVLRRKELLHVLGRAGLNRFTAYSPRDLPAKLRFPVFIRDESKHWGSLTPLLFSGAEVRRWLARLTLKSALSGIGRELLIVEYLDTSDAAGVYRKYSAFRIGERILPRHVLFSTGWVVKKPDLVDPGLLREEQDYLATNPDEAWLREVFDLARIDYGRIDYSMLDGEPQVWEINTCPTVIPIGGDTGPRRELHRRFCQQWWDAMAALNEAGSPRGRPTVRVADPHPTSRQAAGAGLTVARRLVRRHPQLQRAASRVLDALPGPVAATMSAVAGRSLNSPDVGSLG